MKKKKIPLGTDNFEDIRLGDTYYVDKSRFIAELLQNCASVNLFTRPRRFGKSLNMSMLKCFFETGGNPALFDGLAITKETALCEQHMNRYPVIFLTLKTVEGLRYQDALDAMTGVIRREADRHNLITFDAALDEVDKTVMRSLRSGMANLSDSILELSRLLYKYYGRKAVILIDEYDVPLQKAEKNGYYREMVQFISQFFSNTMKTNPYMQFAVVTGCLRISKESIFTGFNNVVVHSIVDEAYDGWFGFTDEEVRALLAYYEKLDYYPIAKEWYDGYRFGRTGVYCPWDVMNWLSRLLVTGNEKPQNYWINTSDNKIIYRFAELADAQTRDQLGMLMEGKRVKKKLNFNLTYDDLDRSIENLWSVLVTTGYLTQLGQDADDYYELAVPNREILDTFIEIVNKWFYQSVNDDAEGLAEFFAAMDTCNAQAMEDCLNLYMQDSISYVDGGRIKEKETFYHGFILGMLKNRSRWEVRSNREAGDGRFDIAAYPKRGNFAVIFEFKYSKKTEDLKLDAQNALEQIKERSYDQFFDAYQWNAVFHFGIAFHKKRCKVAAEQREE